MLISKTFRRKQSSGSDCLSLIIASPDLLKQSFAMKFRYKC